MSIQARIVFALLGIALCTRVATGGYAYWRAHAAIVDTQRSSIGAVSVSRAEHLGIEPREWLHMFDEIVRDGLLINSLLLYQQRAYSRYRRRS